MLTISCYQPLLVMPCWPFMNLLPAAGCITNCIAATSYGATINRASNKTNPFIFVTHKISITSTNTLIIMSTSEEDKNETPTIFTKIKPSREEVLACQFHKWYPQFRKSRITIRSLIIPLKDHPKFISYLLSDGCFLPKNTTSSMFLETDQEDDENNPGNDFDLDDLDRIIEEYIERLGGLVMPKLNWSSPKDASWMNCNGSLKCKCPGDIYLLLKSSDFITHDLLYAFDCVEDKDVIDNVDADEGDAHQEQNEIDYYLVLRKWSNLYPSMEFRCFVANHKIIAISQRHHSQYYAYLHKQKFEIKDAILAFYHDMIHCKYSMGDIQNYSFDCYVDNKRKVWLIDFNVWGSRTDSLLFTWEELNSYNEQIRGEGNVEEKVLDFSFPNMKLVGGSKEIHPDPLASYRAPLEAIDFTSNSFQDFMRMCESPHESQETMLEHNR